MSMGAKCEICYKEISDLDKKYFCNNCGHAFHRNCIEIVLENQNECPICKLQFVIHKNQSHHMSNSVKSSPIMAPERIQRQQTQRRSSHRYDGDQIQYANSIVLFFIAWAGFTVILLVINIILVQYNGYIPLIGLIAFILAFILAIVNESQNRMLSLRVSEGRISENTGRNDFRFSTSSSFVFTIIGGGGYILIQFLNFFFHFWDIPPSFKIAIITFVVGLFIALLLQIRQDVEKGDKLPDYDNGEIQYANSFLIFVVFTVLTVVIVLIINEVRFTNHKETIQNIEIIAFIVGLIAALSNEYLNREHATKLEGINIHHR